MENEFKREYLCKWVADDIYQEFYNLWYEYHMGYEYYDDGVTSTRPARPYHRYASENEDRWHNAKLNALRDVEADFANLQRGK